MAGIQVIFSKLLKNKTGNDNAITDNNTEALLGQSPIIEPDARKRRKAKIKDKK